VLVATHNGLFRRDGDKLVAIGGDQNIGWANSFHATSAGTLLIGAEHGLFRRDGDKLVAVGRDTGWVYAFHAASGGTMLISAERGLFRLGPCP
jgi:hypothetical protein